MITTIAILSIILPAAITGEDMPRSWRLYDAVASVHMQAEVTIAQKGMVGKGSFEYWAEGSKYRIKCQMDPQLGLMSDVDYAFDGENFQFLLHDADTLSIKAGDSRELPSAVPNPFFLPVSYLDPDDDDCRTCALKLRDVKENPRVYRSRSKGGVPVTLRASDTGIEWLRKDGSVFISISYDRPVDEGFPRRIGLAAFQGSLKLTEAEFLIRVLEINTAIPPETYQIPTDVAARVWDERDAHAELRR
jgi:hypothetical protein